MCPPRIGKETLYSSEHNMKPIHKLTMKYSLWAFYPVSSKPVVDLAITFWGLIRAESTNISAW